MNKRFSSAKFKYGSVALTFTIVFVIFVILFNAIFSVVANKKGGFYVDLTGEQIYSLSEPTLDAISGLQKNVEIIFCMTEDKLDDSTEMSYIKRLAEKYVSASDKISVSYVDCVKNPTFFNQFKKSSTDTISMTSVIINCAENKRYVVYKAENFFKFTSETPTRIFAYDGENKFTSAIMQAALNTMQKAAFIKGHGELHSDAFSALLVEQGYEVSDINLKETSAEELAQYNLLIICNPLYDYTGISDMQENRVNEISMLNDYLNKNFGNLMVFIDYETPGLKEFSAFLADDWGVSHSEGGLIVESADSAVSSLVATFIGTPDSTGEYATKIHASVTKSGAQATLFGYATPLNIEFSEKANKKVDAVYRTSKKAQLYKDGEIVSASSAPVMTLSTYTKVYNNSKKQANVLVCGSIDFLNHISNNAYANADILKSAFALMGNVNVVTGIDYKVIEDTTITVSQKAFRANVIRLSVIIPLIIAAIGIFVYIKRKKA
ncbi:MAG: Gldg family protein [Clostridia bacterium]|nr:Gldg family protein [Clostridia bacterium]